MKHEHGNCAADLREQEMLTLARQALDRYRKLQGARIVELILPVEGLAETVGIYGTEPTNNPDQPRYTRGPIRERKIEMSDRKALADYLRACRKLSKQIEADLQLGHDKEAAAKQREHDEILKHIREITTPAGGIKFFPSSETKEYQRQFQAFQYLLKKLRITDPEVYGYLKRHVRTGIPFTWDNDPE